MLKTSTMASVLNAETRGMDVEFASLSIDTRRMPEHAVYLALKGTRFDGHAFVAEAVAKGAVAAVVEQWVDVDVPQVRVQDTRLALGAWAQWWADRHPVPRIAVTGSSGKTSVKEMMAAIMALRGPVLATQGNLNNDIGVPLTLLRFEDTHRSAVLELGANHLGEIAYTSGLVKPDVALITNVGEAHLEGFGSRENISRAKSEIYGGIKPGGTAVINADDVFAPQWLALNGQRNVITFSLSDRGATVHAISMEADSAGRYCFQASVAGVVVSVRLKVLGRHQVANALAAMAATHAVGMSTEDMVVGLSSLTPIKGRMCPVSLGQWTWIDDTYNANPSSIKAALHSIRELPEPRTVLLGGMGELGDTSVALHREVGAAAAYAGLQRLILVGERARDYAIGYHDAGGIGQTWCVDGHGEAAELLLREMPVGLVLAKGSRSAAMEKVFEAAADLLSKGE